MRIIINLGLRFLSTFIGRKLTDETLVAAFNHVIDFLSSLMGVLTDDIKPNNEQVKEILPVHLPKIIEGFSEFGIKKLSEKISNTSLQNIAIGLLRYSNNLTAILFDDNKSNSEQVKDLTIEFLPTLTSSTTLALKEFFVDKIENEKVRDTAVTLAEALESIVYAYTDDVEDDKSQLEAILVQLGDDIMDKLIGFGS